MEAFCKRIYETIQKSNGFIRFIRFVRFVKFVRFVRFIRFVRFVRFKGSLTYKLKSLICPKKNTNTLLTQKRS